MNTGPYLFLPQEAYYHILEFKMTTGATALQQIHDNRYAQSFLGGQKKIILLGIAFDKEKRNTADWEKAIISPANSSNSHII